MSSANKSRKWRKETVSLNSFIGSADILVRFQTLSGYGQDIYVDDININGSPTGIADLNSEKNISIYPNPTTGEAFLKMNFESPQDVTVTVSNILGSTINTFLVKNNVHGVYPIDLSGQPAGNYFVNIKTDKETITRRIFVSE